MHLCTNTTNNTYNKKKETNKQIWREIIQRKEKTKDFSSEKEKDAVAALIATASTFILKRMSEMMMFVSGSFLIFTIISFSIDVFLYINLYFAKSFVKVYKISWCLQLSFDNKCIAYKHTHSPNH